MSVLTKQQLEKILEIIQRHVSWFLWRLFGDAQTPHPGSVAVPAEMSTQLPSSLIQLAFVLGEQEAVMKQTEWTQYGWTDLTKDAERPLTPIENLQVKASELSAHSKYRALGEDIANGLYSKLAAETKAAVSEAQVRGVIKDAVKTGVILNQKYLDVMKELVVSLKEDKRNWSRVASTEMHSVRQRGIAQSIIGKVDFYKDSDGIDSDVAIVPAPDACEDCKRLYLDPKTGNPKIFKLSVLMSNEGSNYVRPWRQHARPVIPPLHPHCFCRMRYVPPGWGWNKKGEYTLVDPDKAFPDKD